MKNAYTVTVYATNALGMLTRIAAIFSRRRVNIESLQVLPSELTDIHRFTFSIMETEEVTRNLSMQLDKQVEVLKTCYNVPA